MPNISAEFERSHPQLGRQMQVEWIKIGDFRQMTRYNTRATMAVTPNRPLRYIYSSTPSVGNRR